jgi:hypothetical protein
MTPSQGGKERAMTDIQEHIVERVARAIADSLNAEGFTAYPSDFENQARAAIEALGGERVSARYQGGTLLAAVKPEDAPFDNGIPALLIPLGEEGEQ